VQQSIVSSSPTRFLRTGVPYSRQGPSRETANSEVPYSWPAPSRETYTSEVPYSRPGPSREMANSEEPYSQPGPSRETANSVTPSKDHRMSPRDVPGSRFQPAPHGHCCPLNDSWRRPANAQNVESFGSGLGAPADLPCRECLLAFRSHEKLFENHVKEHGFRLY
jgi:hypothetical protein